MAEPVGDPYVALAVDVKTAVGDSGPEIFGFARVRGREARHFIAGVRDPDPILLIDGKVKWPEERLARLSIVAFADDPAFSPVTLGEVQELALRDAESPYVAARRGDDALHEPELPVEGDTLRGVSGLPFLSNTAIDLPPYVENQALSLASTAVPNEPPCMPPPANPVVIGDSGLPFGLNLVALPCHNESCPCQPMVKLSPTQRLPSLSNIALPPAR